MHIDWITLGAQMLNFLILVALLKRFLYGPILAVIAQREAHIAGRLQEAQEKVAEAHQQETHYRNALQELHTSAERLLQEARQEADRQRQHLLEQARQDVQHLAQRWHASLQQEQQTFLHALRQQAGEQVCAITRQALAELAQVDLECCIIAVFMARLAALDDPTRQILGTAAQATPLVVRTAFALSADEQQRLRQEIATQLASAVPVHFETTPSLLCGIELEVPGQHKVAWTLDEYLEHFEEHFATQLAATATAQA